MSIVRKEKRVGEISLGGTSSCIIVRLSQIYARDVSSPQRFAISRRATKLKQETFAGENW